MSEERGKKRRLLSFWVKRLKEIIKNDRKPLVIICGKIEDEKHHKISFHVEYPGMKQSHATQLMYQCSMMMLEQLKQDQSKNGPRIILPSQK